MMCGLTWAMGLLNEGTGSSARGGHAGGDTISGFENVMGSAYGDDLTAMDGVAGKPAAPSGVSTVMTNWKAAPATTPWKAAPARMR